MTSRLPRLAAAAALLVAVPMAWPPLAHSQSERFADTTDVVLVQIPVHVTRDGEPVRGLTAENFEVLEGRKKQTVVSVDVFDLAFDPSTATASRGTAVAADIPPAGRRNFVMLFDLSNSLPAGIVRARQAALELVESRLHPTDLVAVATYSQSQGVELVLGFTTDRIQLEAALDDLGLSNPFERVSDPLRLAVAELEARRFSGGGGGPGGNQGNAMMAAFVSHLEALSDISSRATRDQVKQQILDLSTNLDELARLLDSAAGRKQVVLFSQGFDSEIVFGTQDMERIGEIVESVQYGETWRVDSEERFGASDAQGSLLSMLERFNRSDCAVHAVDVGGLAAGGDAATQRVGGQSFGGSGSLDRGHDGLALMASQTGGEFYRNFNDLGDAMDDLLERTSVTYVVSIEPRSLEMDGSYHPLKVRLKGVGKGHELSHRPGYYASRPYADLGPMERQMVTAEQLVAGAAGGRIVTELLAAAFPGADGAAWVLTAVEIDGTSLIADQPDNMVPTEIYTYAFDDQGQIRDFFSQAVALDLYKVGYRLDAGFKLLSHLELPPGSYEIRSLVRNARTGASGLAVNRIEVPSFEDGLAVLLPPFFIEPDDRWLVGRGQREDASTRYPLMASDKPLVPATHPRLVVGEEIPVMLVGHELPLTLEAEGHLIGANGRVRERIDIQVERRIADRGDGERLMATLTAHDVEPGEYRLIVTVRGGGREATSSVPVSFASLN